MTDLMKRVGERAVGLIVLDISDLEASIPLEILDRLQEKGNKLVIVLNKQDVLPHSVKPHRVKHWARTFLRQKHPIFERVSASDIHLVSSKNGKGMNNLVQKLKTAVRNVDGYQNSYLYVLGATNSGKSSLITELRKATKKCKTKRKSPKLKFAHSFPPSTHFNSQRSNFCEKSVFH